MIESKGDEGHDGKVDSKDLGDDFSRTDTEEDRHTHQPVTADTSEEDLMPFRSDDFAGCEGDSEVAVDGSIEGASVPSDDDGEEQHACEVTEEGDGPVDEEFPESASALNQGNSHEHHVTGDEVGAGQDDHGQSDGEVCRANGTDQSWYLCQKREMTNGSYGRSFTRSICLEPWCRICAQDEGATEAEKRTSDD